MSKFIKVHEQTESYEKPIYINTNSIIYIVPNKNNTTTILVSGITSMNSRFHVKESIENVLKQL